jgi:hypothetical protein
LKKNYMNKQRKNKNKNKKKGGAQLMKLNRTVFGAPITATISYLDQISSVSGSLDMHFGLSGDVFSDLHNLQSSGDYTNLANKFRAARMTFIHIEVCRLLGPNNITTTYANGVIPQLYIAYIPTFKAQAFSYTVTSDIESAKIVGAFDDNLIQHNWTVPSVQALAKDSGITDVFIDPTHYWSTTISEIPGELVIGAQASANALLTTPIYSIKVFCTFFFAVPY